MTEDRGRARKDDLQAAIPIASSRIDFDATHDVSISTLRTTYRFRRYARRIDFDATHDVSISTLRTTYRFRRYVRRIDFDATHVVSILMGAARFQPLSS